MTPSKSGLAPNSAWSSKTRCSTSCCSPPVLRRLISRKSAELVPPGVVAQAVRCRTVSHQDASQFPVAEFDRFQAFLSETYPHIESTLKKLRVGQHSLLYQWPATDTSLRPILLMAHQDVVPIDPVSAQMWTHAP